MKYPKITILLGLLLFVITACQPRERELSFRSIAQRDVINYREKISALFVIANNDEIDALVSDVLAEDPALVDQLRQLDYDRFFAILVLHGYIGSTGVSVTVQQITRQDKEVTVQAEFIQPAPRTRTMPAFTSPYHLIAVSKRGEWGQQIRFVLVVDGNEVAEIDHFIP